MQSVRNASRHFAIRSTVFAAALTVIIVLSVFASPALAVDTLGQISIPALSLDAPIIVAPLGYPSWDLTHLGARVGYLQGTGQIGQTGNMVIAGHSTTTSLAPSVFANLHTLQAGDEIIVNMNGVEKRYVVNSVSRVDQTDLAPVMPTAHEQLTLLTCATESFQASNASYTQRYIVVATPV